MDICFFKANYINYYCLGSPSWLHSWKKCALSDSEWLYNQNSSQIFDSLELTITFSWQVVQCWVQSQKTRKCKNQHFHWLPPTHPVHFYCIFSFFVLSLSIYWKLTLPDHFNQVRGRVRLRTADRHTCCHILRFLGCASQYCQYRSNFHCPYNPNWHCQKSMLIWETGKEEIW